MNKIHPIFEQALAPFLKPVATRNGPEPNVCPDCHGKGASTIDKATGKTVYYCNCDTEAATPYPWCRQKDKCRGKGSCPLDPTCGD